MRNRWLAVLAVTLLCTATVTDAEIYKWTDDQGVTHYTQQPPPDDEATVLDPNIGSASEAAAEPSEQTAEQGEADADGEDTQSIEAFCKQLRKEIEALEGDGTVKVRTDEDTLKELDDEERQARLERAQSQLESQCS